MPVILAPDGTNKVVPGVYVSTEVRSSLPGAVPTFHVPMAVVDVDSGYPYNFDTHTDKLASEPERGAFSLVTSVNAARALAGIRSGLAIALNFAFKHKLPLAYVTTASPLTRAKINATSGTGSVNEILIASKLFGPAGGWIKIKAPSGTSLEVLAPRSFALLTANVASGDTRLYVKHTGWVRVGQTISLGDNASALVTKVVKAFGEEVTSTGQVLRYIDITTTAGAAYTTALYGAVAEYDEQDRLVSGTLSGDALIEWIGITARNVLVAERAAGYSGVALDAVAADTTLKEIAAWDTPQVGTAPAATTGNHTTLIGAIESTWWDDFLQRHSLVPRAWYVGSSASVDHGSWRDFCTARRVEGVPTSLTSGVAWGDIVLDAGDDTDPLFRAAALNSQEAMLCAPGLDREAAALSLAPAVWALRAAGGVGHNLTQDTLLYSHIETQWNERGALELTRLHQAGVCTIRLRGSAPYNYVVSQGLSTLQRNLVAWNVDDSTTCLVAQRDNADAVAAALQDELDGRQLGVEVSRDSLAAVLVAKGAQLQRQGWIQRVSDGFAIQSLTLDDSGNGWRGTWRVRIPPTTDYLAGTNLIIIGE